jgi:N-acetylneuraminic acid mutarotase
MNAWQQVRTLPNKIEAFAGVFFDNRACLLCGYDDDLSDELSVFASIQNGINNEKILNQIATLPKRQYLAACVFDNKMFVSGGRTGGTAYADVLCSTTGASWETLYNSIPSGLFTHSMLEFDNKLVILGGFSGVDYNNQIRISTNGRNWEQVTTIGSMWSARGSMAALVYKGKLWIYGGYDGTNEFNDVWWTDDLIHWHLAIEHAPWEARYEAGFCVFDERMWIFGGDGDDLFTDVWFSRDGSTWERGFDLPYHLCETFAVVLENKVHLIGGFNNQAILKMNLG